VTVSYTTAAPGQSTVDLNADAPNAQHGTCFYTDDTSAAKSEQPQRRRCVEHGRNNDFADLRASGETVARPR
jgi:hypothetical protein